MKKRILALVLILATLAAMSLTAGAAGTGTISVENLNPGESYNVYKVLDIEYNDTTGAFRYVLPAGRAGFLSYAADITGDSVNEAMSTYFSGVEESGKTYISALFSSNSSAAALAARLVRSYIETNSIGGTAYTGAALTKEYGYYLLDSTVGDICALGTLVPAAVDQPAALTLREKNIPGGIGGGGVEKDCVWEDPYYKYTITVTSPEGGKKFFIHDYSTNLEIDTATVEVILPAGVNLDGSVVAYKEGDAAFNTKPFGASACPAGCNMHIWFTVDTELPAYSEIKIKYAATATGEATNGAQVDVWDKDDNNITDDPSTPIDFYNFKLEKQDNSTGTRIEGAKFLIYKMDGGKKYYAKFAFNGADTYSFKGWTEISTEATEVEVGVRWINGISGSTIYLEETLTPNGYMKPDAPVVLRFEKSLGVQTITVEGGSATVNGNTVYVKNAPGTPLPETGGIGTTVFYVIGGVLVLGAVIILIMKKRSANN